ncbi:hypothetical protein HK096_002839 [Nowakowskiella sp. JEL0078]|nr:hypothetical protein HK096_002839 [Nowakowskiella sp. JEL0078]
MRPQIPRNSRLLVNTQKQPSSIAPFFPKKPDSPLASFAHRTADFFNRPKDPLGKTASRKLMRDVEYDQRFRHDFDSRSSLFDPNSPTYCPPGTILLIEQLSSRTRPQPQIFAGVLLEIRQRGIASTIVLRNYVLKAGVELIIPVYSPMVSKIVVLRRLTDAQLLKLREKGNPLPPTKRIEKSSRYVWRETRNVNFIRENPGDCPVSFSTIEDMIRKYRQRDSGSS